MREVKRYGFWHGREREGEPGEFEEMPAGPYVLYDDYAALERERDKLLEALRQTLVLIEGEREVLERSFLPEPNEVEQVLFETYEEVQVQARAAISAAEERVG